MSDTLILYDSVSYFKNLMVDKGVDVYPTFKKVNSLQKLFRKLSFLTGIYRDIWYGEWKYNLKEIKTVIVFATNRIDQIEYLRRINPDVRIIYWYWNPVFRCYDPSKINSNLCELWTFDEIDASNYGLKHNTTFYFDSIKLKKNVASIKRDVLFVGADKGRASSLLELEQQLKLSDISTLFHIVPSSNQPNPTGVKNIPYEIYLDLISESKVIVDFIQESQHGLTLRPMESIFLKKKLITNDETIVHHDFYNPQNIFILHVDKIESLKDFINSEYIEIDQKIVMKYDFQNWLNRFN